MLQSRLPISRVLFVQLVVVALPEISGPSETKHSLGGSLRVIGASEGDGVSCAADARVCSPCSVASGRLDARAQGADFLGRSRDDILPFADRVLIGLNPVLVVVLRSRHGLRARLMPTLL